MFYYGSTSSIDTTAGVDGVAKTATGMELGYNTTVGPTALKFGYGSRSISQTGGSEDGKSMTCLLYTSDAADE